MKKIFCSILLLTSMSLFLGAQNLVNVTGRVFVDSDGDGKWEKGEKVIRNAGVSDGCKIVWTDARGRYDIETDAEFLFPIIPDGYLPYQNGLQNGLVIPLPADQHVTDIPLIPCGRSDRFRVAVVGDVQVDSHDEAQLARNTVLNELSSRKDLDFMIHMGDLVNDKPSLFEELVPSLDQLQFPVWTVIGNHDLDTLDRSHRGTTSFRKEIGSDIGAWFRGKVCFIMIDNVEFMDYAVSDRQLQFIGNLLESCPEDELIVLCQHVPLGWTKNKERVLELLGDRKTLILSAHAHYVFRQEWSENVSEVSVGAACGSWWTGERDMWNNPIALQQCGSPRNYFIFDFDQEEYSFSFKGVGLDPAIQADVSFSDNKLRVNVFGGGEATVVEFSTDGSNWRRMTKKDQLAPYTSRMIHMNREAGYPTAFSRRTPLRKGAVSRHIWEADVPAEQLDKKGILHFRISDSRGLVPFSFDCLGL